MATDWNNFYKCEFLPKLLKNLWPNQNRWALLGPSWPSHCYMAQGNDPGPLWPSCLYLGQSSTASPDLGMGQGEYLGHCEILYNCWRTGASVFHKHILFVVNSKLSVPLYRVVCASYCELLVWLALLRVLCMVYRGLSLQFIACYLLNLQFNVV